MIPKILYRGDSDKGDERLLRSELHHWALYTNLISGGVGNIIFKKPLIDLVKIHINPGWKKTHFLSFTECVEKAIEFGSHEFNGYPHPYMSDDNNWDFALLKFDTTKLIEKRMVEKGVYRCFYKQSSYEPDKHCEILLIDTIEYLKSHMELNVDSQLSNAQRDKEWLVLPTNLITLNNLFVEYSAKLEMMDLIEYELFNVF